MRATVALIALVASLVAGAAVALAAPGDAVLDLPVPVGSIPVPAPVFSDRPERLLVSSVPGTLANDEQVAVGVAPDGAPATIEVTQRIELTGTGDFVIRERTTATSVEALDDTPAPVLRRSAVVWQGFVPGKRSLAARITLDPSIEGPRLPLGVSLAWRPASGAAPLPPSGVFPADGTLVVRLDNRTVRPEQVETGVAPAAAVAARLDTLRAHALRGDGTPPPMAGRGTPATVPGGRADGVRAVTSVAPLRVTGSIGGGVVTGPATTPAPGGATVEGVLSSAVEFSVAARAGDRFTLDLTAVPALDPRPLAPPAGSASWAAWAARGPAAPDVRRATEVLVDAALAAARTDEYMPYLGHHGPGSVRTAFRYSLAPAAAVSAPRPPLRPRPVPIALTLAGLVALAGAGVATWRRA